jgi:hypothetical protein
MYGCSFGLTPGFLYGCVIGHIDSDLPVDRLNPPCASHFHTVMRISSVRFMKLSYSHAHCSSLHTLYARFHLGAAVAFGKGAVGGETLPARHSWRLISSAADCFSGT